MPYIFTEAAVVLNMTFVNYTRVPRTVADGLSGRTLQCLSTDLPHSRHRRLSKTFGWKSPQAPSRGPEAALAGAGAALTLTADWATRPLPPAWCLTTTFGPAGFTDDEPSCRTETFNPVDGLLTWCLTTTDGPFFAALVGVAPAEEPEIC